MVYKHTKKTRKIFSRYHPNKHQDRRSIRKDPLFDIPADDLLDNYERYKEGG